jgi:hypothetical protein
MLLYEPTNERYLRRDQAPSQGLLHTVALQQKFVPLRLMSSTERHLAMRLELGVHESVRRSVASRIQVHLRIKAFLFCALLSLVPSLIRAQDSSSSRGSGERTDIVTENLKRVAATAEQILDILNRNTGLMVELKRWIAHDAGESGQVLEEERKHGEVIFVDEKTITPSDTGGLVRALSNLSRKTAKWDWTNRVSFLRR